MSVKPWYKLIFQCLLSLCLVPHIVFAKEDWQLGPFSRPTSQPVISPNTKAQFDCPMRQQPIRWMSNHTFNPAAVVKDNKIHLLFRAEDGDGQQIGNYTSRIGHALSEDGIHFSIADKPVLYPDNNPQWQGYEWFGGCEDPRIASEVNGHYALYYTQWNKDNPLGQKENARIGVATSTDLIHWQKHGPIFNKKNGRDSWHKSGAIVHKIDNKGLLVAAKIKGKYWMYWGEHGIAAATSKDLIHWQPVKDKKNHIKLVVQTRKGYFDSELAEVGPQAILSPNGIILIYNGKNAAPPNGDLNYPVGSYSAGQVLLSVTDPTKVIARASKPFLVPELPYEKSGQYPQGTVFTEGLVLFKDKWYLYFGAADSLVGVATAPYQW